ncbi:nucleotide pyrophosphohydrolase [Clostridiaceae bacterium M8S5]|nr:nucleotide pyrophosphohydrolase [Clostridiaceae bacterium M8S5]
MCTNIDEIVSEIINFRDARDWKQFHNPKDLAISLNIEAGELLECFQWKNSDEVNELINSKDKKKVEDEIADVGIYLLLLCNELNVSIDEVIKNKLSKNKEKYPINKSKGIATKYTEL